MLSPTLTLVVNPAADRGRAALSPETHSPAATNWPLGPRFAAGIILTTGHRSFTYADGLHVMPIDRLWTPVSS